jgi:hypothetical protein
MVFTTVPLVGVGWLVVTLFETAVFKVGLRRPYREALQAVGAANLASTVMGYPLSWLMGLDHISGPSERYFHIRVFGYGVFWRWILLTVSILTVAFFISVYLEYFIIRRYYRNEQKRRIKHLSWMANLVTYALLLAALLILTYPI